MPPTFKHGVGTRISIHGSDLSAILNDTELTRTVDTHDTSCYATSTGGTTTNKTYAPGLRDTTLSMSGLADGSTSQMDGAFGFLLDNRTETIALWGPGGAAVGDPAYAGQGHITAYNSMSPTADMVAVSAEMQMSYARGGVYLISPVTATTSTGNKATVNLLSTAAGSSTRDAIAWLAVTSLLPGGAASTSTGQVKVQHSTDGVSFSDLATINYSSGNGVYSSTITTTIKEKIRGQVSVHAAAGTDQRLALVFTFK